VIALALALTLAQLPGDLDGPIFSNPATMGGVTGAFFEFAPASGAGMGAACACTAPTGAKGEALTFTRASTAMCTATASGGLATTGIANGDLVLCTTNAPRVEYDSAGTKGLLVEGARTNSVLRSQELNDAQWTTVGTAMTVTANAGTAPDGTLTAERLQIPATSGSGLSLRAQTGLTSGAHTASCYVKGYGGTSGALDIYQSGASFSCGACTYSGSTWTRCSLSAGASVTTLHIGNDSLDCGASRSAQDVLIWGCQSEVGPYATSYIPTTSGTAARQVETGLVYSSISLPSSWSMAASVNGVSALPFNQRGLVEYGTNEWSFGSQSGASYASRGFVGGIAGTTTQTASPTSVARYAVVRDGAGLTVTLYAGGVAGAPQALAGTTSASNSLWIGAAPSMANPPAEGIVSKVCVDPSPTKCR
jgi:hypothetical protein